eukprot:TRINITY_DN30959_c0_g1_i1.p1 TRINITY_DN30959_c0_g1~~TRINITY_DN30959_c0_g1_i1.p1  ORF type:complete len:1024 (-),score=190.02 TRINITY_DN30959_c0_g1_i1:220-3291(-)
MKNAKGNLAQVVPAPAGVSKKEDLARAGSRRVDNSSRARKSNNGDAGYNRRTDPKKGFRCSPAGLLRAIRKCKLRDPERTIWLKAKSRSLCASWRFTALTCVLTIFALFGDDFRLAITHLRTDDLFNALTIISCIVFTIEVLAQSLGQEEYFLGFFFWLDLISTITLALDLTWVSAELFCGQGDNDALKTSRAGRAGARASRTVRIIRLLRLVKLYKAYRAAMEKRREEEAKTQQLIQQLQPGEEIIEAQEGKSEFEVDEDGAEEDGIIGRNEEGKEDDGPKAEMRVGKKLSDMTTRRVIILVLIMLFCLPQFNPESDGNLVTSTVKFQESASFGADMVYSRWRDWCGSDGNSSHSPWCLQQAALQASYLDNGAEAQERWTNRYFLEKALLSFIYYHHSGSFFWKLYWIGAFSRNNLDTESNIGNLASLGRRDLLGERYEEELKVENWDDLFGKNGGWVDNTEPLSSSAKNRLTAPWAERCRLAVGVVVAEESRADGPEGCSITEELRCTEVEYVQALSISNTEEDSFSYVFAFDQRHNTQLEAGLSIMQTIFICFCVGLGAVAFSKDANELLLHPIERMIEKMETIKDNPLEAMRLGDLEFRREEIEQARFREKLAQMNSFWKLLYKYRPAQKSKEPMETVMLEKTIIKLGGLLALGFGEAGAEVIGQNMKGIAAGVDALIPGQKVDAIFGFCNIRNFVDATEVLREKVMLFVNQIGEIVHGCIDDFHGAPNKNIGDSFLLVWRLSGSSEDKQTKLADMALMSYVKIIAEINKSRVLAQYRQHPALQQKMRGFRLEMGFGLHCGWAIEGTIGSEFKIDASYLSPIVNVTARLETATTQYKVWVLISHCMVNLCSHDVALNCRLIDHVTVKGSRQPVRLYTIDLDVDMLDVETRGPERIIRNRFKIRQLREVRKNEKWAEEYLVYEAMRTNPDIQLMRSSYSDEFFQRFAMAYRNYEAGEWMAARDMLFTCHYQPKPDVGRRLVKSEAEWPPDGPTVTLLKFMQKHDFVPPQDWLGHRQLMEK